MSDKLGKLILMLSSDQPGEVAAAASAIGRELSALGRDWHWLAEQVATLPRARQRQKRHGGADRPPETPQYHDRRRNERYRAKPSDAVRPELRECAEKLEDLCSVDVLMELLDSERSLVESLMTRVKLRGADAILSTAEMQAVSDLHEEYVTSEHEA